MKIETMLLSRMKREHEIKLREIEKRLLIIEVNMQRMWDRLVTLEQPINKKETA